MRTRSNEPLRVDCLAREIPDRVALAVSQNWSEVAIVQLLDDLNEVLSAYELKLKTGARSASNFSGSPMTTKWHADCEICGGRIVPGSRVVYDSDLKQVAHARCVK